MDSTSPNTNLLEKTLKYSRKKEYRGYDKHDGMSSKILKKIPIDNKWINLIFQESIKRFPINIRPLLLVEKKRNYKGIGLFVMANLNAYELTGKKIYLDEAKNLSDWLVENRVRGYSGFCVSHSHPVQGLNMKITTNIPWFVETSYAAKALLEISQYFPKKKYSDLAYTASNVIYEDLDYKEDEEGGKMKYLPTDSGESYTLNANALGARFLIDLYEDFPEERFKKSSRKILDYVVSNQTESGGWMYKDPPSASHLNMDNYHNGFIIEALLRYQEVTGSDRYENSIEKALKFYKEILYNKNGSPNWDENNEYPKDIHAVAQGIIVFTKANDLQFSSKIIDWTLDNLYASDGKFYYQKNRFYTKKFTLMRWCQAWMAYSVSKYLIRKKS